MDLSHLRVRYCRNSAVEGIKRSPRWDDEDGVASTIGTIMSLLVFLTFMGMFTNQFVPVWMGDNESSHMAVVTSQMLGLKADVDGLVVDYANSLLAPAPIVVPITLHASGIPIFAEPTAGILEFRQQTMYGMPSVNVSFQDQGGYILNPQTGGHSGGYVHLYAPNRYYVEQYLVYEAGAVIINQTDGEFIISGPQFSVSEATGVRIVKLTQVSMMGMNKTIGGTGTKLVNADMSYVGTTTYENDIGTSLTITIVSPHGNAWEAYFNRALNESLADLDQGTDYTVSKQGYPYVYLGRTLTYHVVTITIDSVNVFDHTYANMQISLGEVAP